MKNIKSFKSLFEDQGGYLMSKSYQVTTPESAEAGDYEDQGMEYENKKFDTLWAVAEEIRDEGATEPSNSGNATKHTWYSTPDGDQNFVDGSVKYYSFHPKLNSDEEAQELFDMIKMDYRKFREMDPSMQESEMFEGISGSSFTQGLARSMEKYLPKDRWTISYEMEQIVVKNDFDETGTYRLEKFESNEGTFTHPNIPSKGSVDENEKAIDVDNELFEAFRRFLLNTARIDPKNITSIDAYNKYCIIHTNNDEPKRVDFKVGYNV